MDLWGGGFYERFSFRPHEVQYIGATLRQFTQTCANPY